MSYFDDASLVMIPSGYKDQKVYSVKPIDGSGDLTFSRASNATRVNSSGLVEKVRTNLALQSNTFSNATWIKTDVSVASGQSGYDGTSNAWLLSATASSGNLVQAISFSGVNTLSFYAKQGTLQYVYILLNGGGFNGTAAIDLADGTIYNASAFLDSIKTTNVGGGWFRIEAVSSRSNSDFRIYPSNNNSGGTTATGNIYIQDAQVETGDIATDYIATTSAAVSVGPVSGLPRLDYSGGASCPSLLLEPQRTNYVQFSEQINNPTWATLNANFTVNATTSPDGYTNADKLGGTIGVSDQVYIGESLALPSAGTYTYSFFAKADDKSWVRLRTLGFDAAANTQTWFNLANGTIGTDGSGNAKIEAWPNGWYRCSYSFTTTTDLIGSVYAYLAQGDGGFAVTRDGSGIFLWGAQLEAGAYASSYIGPTYSSAVTRVADSAYKTGISSLIGQTAGTLFVEYNSNITEDDSFFLVIDDGTANNRIVLYSNVPNNLALVINAGGVLQAVIPNIPLASGTNKFAVAYANNDIALYLNGVSKGTDNTATIPATSALRMGTDNTGAKIASGKGINQALVFKTRLSNADLATLTTL